MNHGCAGWGKETGLVAILFGDWLKNLWEKKADDDQPREPKLLREAKTRRISRAKDEAERLAKVQRIAFAPGARKPARPIQEEVSRTRAHKKATGSSAHRYQPTGIHAAGLKRAPLDKLEKKTKKGNEGLYIFEQITSTQHGTRQGS